MGGIRAGDPAATIIKAKMNDAPAIAHLNEQFRLDIPEFRWGDLEWVEKEIGKGNYYVIRDAQGVAGALCLDITSEEHRKAGVIEAMAVRADRHGQGLGQELINYAKEVCSKDPSLRRLVVESFCEYPPEVKKFYQSCGFNADPELRTFKGHDYYYFWMPVKQQNVSGEKDRSRI